MENIEEVFDFMRNIDDLDHFDVEDNLEVGIPRQSNIYIRNYMDPFEFYSDATFYDRYRFSKNTVRNVIVPLINGVQHSTMRGLPIPTELQVTIALRYFATGTFQIVCGDLHFISQSTVSRIVKHISGQLAGRMREYVRFPDDLESVKRQFEMLPNNRYPGLTNIIGAIDCTHVKIKRPRGIEHSEVYRNRKGYISINVQAIVGQDMKIYDFVARWPGSSHDSRIFRNSRVHALLQSGQLQGILVGDSGYRATHFMLTPYINPSTTAEERYNYVQVRTRNVVERVFGTMKKKFECLRVGIGTKLTTATNIIVSCAVLHNIAIDAGEYMAIDDYREEEPLSQPRQLASGLAFRSNIVNNYYNY